MTKTQAEVMNALAALSKDRPKTWSSAAAIRDERLGDKVDEKGTFLRTTKNALRQLSTIVPKLVQSSAVGWRMTAAGRTMAETQLNI